MEAGTDAPPRVTNRTPEEFNVPGKTLIGIIVVRLWTVYWTVSLTGGEVTIVGNSPRGTGVVLSLPRMPANSSVRGTSDERH